MAYKERDPMLPNGSDKCQCPTCKEYFNSSYGFTEHRIGKVGGPDRRCLTPAELLAKGWGKSKTGHWVTETKDAKATARVIAGGAKDGPRP